ncbi:MAG: hypothetical protein FJ202_10195 [Gemmatimonadetes bacterium]|nr:hypothetical protein [Gemmatimonadota bacterium]
MLGALLPELSHTTQAVVRVAYGVLTLLTLAQALPEARRFFLSERWSGYVKSMPAVDALQNPWVMPLVMAVWCGAAVAIIFGWATPWSALINLVLCRYFFIHPGFPFCQPQMDPLYTREPFERTSICFIVQSSRF